MVRLLGTVTGVTVLAITDRQSICGYGGEVMASPGSSVGASQLVVPGREHRYMIHRFHDLLFAGHLGVSWTVYRLQNRVYWPGLRHDVRSYLASCPVCLARSMLMWDTDGIGVAMDLLDMFVTTAKGTFW